MTTNVSIHNTPGHWKVKVFRRFKDGSETELRTIEPGEMISGPHEGITLWDGCELVIREVPIETPAA